MEKTLVLPGPRPKRIRVAVVGKALEQTTWSAKGVAKTTTKAFENERAAVEAFHKTVRKKLREDYAFVANEHVPGDIILEAFAPGGGGGAVLDLSRDGKYVVTASITSEAQFGAKLEVVEVDTGARRVVVDEPSGRRQSFLHAALFDRGGRNVYYLLCDDIWRVDLISGERRVVVHGSGFNPFVVQPSFDRERRRLVVGAENWVVRVLDADSENVLLDVPTAAASAECRAARISPSGRLLAIYMASRNLIYNHRDAAHDTTNEVQIWDIEAGVKFETVQMSSKVDDVGFTPADDALAVTYDYASGPLALEIPAGQERWRLRDPREPHELARAQAWAFSPSGDQLAIAGAPIQLYDAATLAPLELAERSGEAKLVAFSADGRRLAAVIGGTAVVFAL